MPYIANINHINFDSEYLGCYIKGTLAYLLYNVGRNSKSYTFELFDNIFYIGLL